MGKRKANDESLTPTTSKKRYSVVVGYPMTFEWEKACAFYSF